MPFKSQAQRRKFAELLVEGKISPETYEEWNRETGSARLPDRVKRKTPRKRSATRERRKPGARTKTMSTRTKRRKATGRRSGAKRR
jgi:hypothetical protein